MSAAQTTHTEMNVPISADACRRSQPDWSKVNNGAFVVPKLTDKQEPIASEEWEGYVRG